MRADPSPRRALARGSRATSLDRTLTALADPQRRAIVEWLRRRPGRPSEVAQALRMTRPTMSRHLRVLRGAGLVADEALASDARARVLQLRTEPLSGLRVWVEQLEALWSEQLLAFKAHAERKGRGGR